MAVWRGHWNKISRYPRHKHVVEFVITFNQFLEIREEITVNHFKGLVTI